VTDWTIGSLAEALGLKQLFAPLAVRHYLVRNKRLELTIPPSTRGW
jgi:hypothetical protein